jgi:hypothetical protein
LHKRDRRTLLWIALVAAAVVWHYSQRPRTHPPGILVADAPLQTSGDLRKTIPNKGDIAITPLAKFSMSARVLGRADYHFDTGAKLAPVDLALGWARMSDSAVLEKVDISQSTRFYHWQVRELPIPASEIIESSANMHLIPADTLVERAIGHTRVGDIVSFDGYLVRADGPKGYQWTSSLTRTDSGNGACELVWVEHFDIKPP